MKKERERETDIRRSRKGRCEERSRNGKEKEY